MIDKGGVEEHQAVIVQNESVNPNHIKIIEGSTDILLIAPHACIRNGEPKDDENTGPITEMVARQTGCSSIINTYFHKPGDKGYPHGLEDGNLNMNLIADAQLIPDYLNAIRAVIDTPGKTTVIWIHGADDKKVKKVSSKVKYPYQPNQIHAFIGYGQGDDPITKTVGSRYTAELTTVNRFRDALIRNEMNAVVADDEAANYRGRNEERMNQWFLNQGYTHEQVESIQLEIRYKGFREDAAQCQNTARIIADAISATLELKPIVMEGAEETQLIEPTTPDENMTEETVVALTLSQEEATASKIPAENIAKKSLDKNEDDDAVAETAYMWLTDQFKKHITNFMHEAGKYIIKNFYNNDPMLAFAKNKTSEQPPSLNLLIKKIQQSSKNPSESAPSVSWFYKAVNLAAHEAICKQMGLSTFTILGHSHKLQLLYVPKLKSIQADMLDKSITPAFQEKERLAIVAHEKGFSVRDFKKYIDGQYPEETINLTASPSMADLQSLGPKKLERLRKITQKKIEDSQKLIAAYTASLMDMDAVLAEIHCAAAEGKDQKKK